MSGIREENTAFCERSVQPLMHSSIHKAVEGKANVVALSFETTEFAVEAQHDMVLEHLMYVPLEPVVTRRAEILDQYTIGHDNAWSLLCQPSDFKSRTSYEPSLIRA